MAALNEPTGWQPDPVPSDWSPARGLWRGAVTGMAVAVVLALVSGVVAALAPLIVINAYLRLAGAFFLTLILLTSVQRGAGMVGWSCTGLAVGQALLVLFSNHLCFAVFGVQGREQVLHGWMWLSPPVLLVVNGLAFVGVGFGAALGHRGGVFLETVVDLLMTNPLTGRRQ